MMPSRAQSSSRNTFQPVSGPLRKFPVGSSTLSARERRATETKATNPPGKVSKAHRLTFGGFKEADTWLDLGPVNGVIFYRVLHHELEQLHRDDVMIVWGTAMSAKNHQKL